MHSVSTDASIAPAMQSGFPVDLGSAYQGTEGSECPSEPAPEPPPPKKRIAKLLKKTSLCKHYMRGNCRFEDKCAYAHQADELSKRPDLAKTRMCVSFLAGSCEKEDCKYAHAFDEVLTRAKPSPSQKSSQASSVSVSSAGTATPSASRASGSQRHRDLQTPSDTLSQHSMRSLNQPMLQAAFSPQMHPEPTPYASRQAALSPEAILGAYLNQAGRNGPPSRSRSEASWHSDQQFEPPSPASRNSRRNQWPINPPAMRQPPVNYEGELPTASGYMGGPLPLPTAVPQQGPWQAPENSDDQPMKVPLPMGVVEAPLQQVPQQQWRGFDLAAPHPPGLRQNPGHLAQQQVGAPAAEPHPGIQPNPGQFAQQQVSVAESLSSKKLFEWLRTSEHAETLSPATRNDIVQLFQSDPVWAAKFPGLAARCLNWNDADTGEIVYSI